VTAPQLDDDLKQLLSTYNDPRVFINGDTKVEFGKAITVLDQVRSLGITKVAIETQPQAQPGQPKAQPGQPKAQPGQPAVAP